MFIFTTIIFMMTSDSIDPMEGNPTGQNNLGLWIPGTGFGIFCQWNLHSGFQSLIAGFRILLAVFRIPKPRIPDSTSWNFQDSGMRIYFTWGKFDPSKSAPRWICTCFKCRSHDKNVLRNNKFASWNTAISSPSLVGSSITLSRSSCNVPEGMSYSPSPSPYCKLRLESCHLW